MHILQVMTFLPGRYLTKTCPFATRYLKISRSGLVPSYFLLSALLSASAMSIFFCLVVFQGLPPQHILISPETTFINDSTGDLPCKQFNVKETLKIQSSLLNSTSAYKTPSICGNPAEHT